MGEFAIGQSVSAVRGSAPPQGRGPLCGRYRAAAAWRSATCCARRTPMRAFARSIQQGEGGAGRARGAHRSGLAGLGMGRPAGPRWAQAPRRRPLSPPYPAACQRSRALGRRLRRLRRGGDARSSAGRGRIDRGRLRAAARRRLDRAGASTPGAPRVWDECPDNIGFVQLFGDKAATDAAFAEADHVVKHRFVINRITAATHGAARLDRRLQRGRRPLHDLHHAAARASLPRRAGARSSKCRRASIRVVAGDIGGSFGMKSAIYNEVALVLLASKLLGRPVKWISTRSESFLSDAQARDNVTDAELALDKDGIFLGLRVKHGRHHRRLSADRHAGLHRQHRHARRRLSHACHPCRRHRRVHAHQSGAALSRQRPAGSRLS